MNITISDTPENNSFAEDEIKAVSLHNKKLINKTPILTRIKKWRKINKDILTPLTFMGSSFLLLGFIGVIGGIFF